MHLLAQLMGRIDAVAMVVVMVNIPMVIIMFCLLLPSAVSATSVVNGIGSVMFAMDAGMYQYEFVYNVTKHLQRIHRFHSFVVVRDSRIQTTPSFAVSRSLEQLLVDEFGQPIFVLGPHNKAQLRSTIGLDTMAFVELNSMQDPMHDVVDYALQGLHFMPTMFMFKNISNITPSMTEIKRFFAWCWRLNFINAVLTFPVFYFGKNHSRYTKDFSTQYQVFGYTPFPRLTVRNLTGTIYSNAVFVDLEIREVEGYTFRTPIYQDPPLVFLTSKPTRVGAKEDFEITGTIGRLFNEYVRSINGTIRMLPYSNLSFYNYHRDALLTASKKQIDIVIHPYSGLHEFANQTEGSYPVAQTNACIIVPVRPEIYRGLYIVRTFQPIVRCCVFIAFAGIIILQLWQSNFDIGQSILYAYNILVYQPLTWTNFNNRRIRSKLFHLFLLIFGYLITCMFSTSLTSLLSTTIWAEQIQTVDDFLASDLEIMLHEYEQKIFFDMERLPSSLRSRLRVVDLETLLEHRNALNTTYAYIVTSEVWLLITMEQRLLWKPYFRIASDSLCTGNYFLKFPLQWDSPFQLSLAIFQMTIMESGLHIKWHDLSIYQAFNMNLIRIIDDQLKHPSPLSTEHIMLALHLYILMCSMALICFLGELLYYKWKKHCIRENRLQFLN